MLNANVCAIFRSTPDSMANLLFAASLLKLTGSKYLNVLVLQHGYRGYLATGWARVGAMRQADLVGAEVERITGLPPELIRILDGGEQLATMRFPERALVVDDHLSLARTDVHSIATWGETSFTRRAGKSVLVPFGDGEAGVRAAAFVQPLVTGLGLKFVFYHTTWRDPKIASDDPHVHMCAPASRIRSQLEELARAAGTPFQTVIEMADDVVEGSLHCAMRVQASLIADARGPNTMMGSYVDQMLAQSPVPVLVVANRKEVQP